MTTTTLCRTAVSDFFGALGDDSLTSWDRHLDADGTVHLELGSQAGRPDLVVDIDARGRCQVATLGHSTVRVRRYPTPGACAAAVTNLLKGNP